MMASAHPSATLGEIIRPRSRLSSQAVLNVPGLEFTYNGRGALLRACKEISYSDKRNILLPAYHCPSGITPAIQAGLNPVFYRIRRDLSIDFDDLYSKVDVNTAAILVIHYFGFASDLHPFQVFRESGVVLIEDWSHSFLQWSPPILSGGESDYRIYSFWKLVPSVVGGGLWRGGNAYAHPRLSLPAPPLRERLVRLKRLFETALNHSNYTAAQGVFFRLEVMRLALRRPADEQVSSAEASLLPGEAHYPFDLTLANCRMPGLSRRILEACDFLHLTQKRRNNFIQYIQYLHPSDQLKLVHPVLPPETCPWTFPVLLQQRSEIDHLWRAAGVGLYTFGNYLHSAVFKHTDAPTIADAQYLSQHLLCLSIHQNISAEQIEMAAGIINRTLIRTRSVRVPQAFFV
jgi:perosamine synthetase